MKTKLLSLIAIFVGLMAVEAQKTGKTNKDLQLKTTAPTPANTKFRKHYTTTYNKTTAAESHWLCYGYSREWINSGGDPVNNPIATFGTTYLFPDSTVMADFSTTFDHPWIHNISNILDVKSPTFQQADSVYWNKFVPYTVDSVSLLYGYHRNHPNTAIVDTLICYLFTNSTAANMASEYFDALSDYSDTVNIKALKYKYAVNTPDVTGMTTIKIPLTVADTAMAFLRFKEFSTKDGGASTFLTVAAGRLVGCAFSFKPGYSYSFGDTITSNKNYFLIRSFEENGDNSVPYYYYCKPKPNEDACDWNVSNIAPTDVRYNMAAGWNGYYIPSYAYTIGYSFEHHYISYKVSATLNPGINEAAANVLELGQNVPNPSSGATTINYELSQNQAVAVNLSIYDITGKKVMSIDQGKQVAGSHAINIDARELQSGVYFYTLTAGENRLTRKMTIVE